MLLRARGSFKTRVRREGGRGEIAVHNVRNFSGQSIGQQSRRYATRLLGTLLKRPNCRYGRERTYTSSG